ncbi:glycosyltransferase family protein, partial [Pseudorhodoplanes sp.]|uniref:glycosyltransferase family protein n=1 Tax=Pseudorhodoplanes sp. TaxID=1934341 RepID=UPI003D0E69D1
MAARDTALGDDVPSDDSVIGFFDRIHRGVLAGWAINRSVPDTPLKLGLWFKGVCIHVASADTFRPDLAQAFGTRGFHGFEFECPTDLRAVDVLDIEVIPVGACSPLQKVEDVILRHGTRLVQTGAPHPDQPNNSGALWKRYRSVPRDFSLAQREPKIGIVIVNRNGSERLERLFASVKQHNSYQSMTFFIIDQGSTDDSRLVCARWAMRLPITFIERRINFSIAASRNYGARLASDCGLLMFLKSDIELCADALPSMAAFMSHDDCCLLGVRLRTGADGPGVSNAHSDHLGIALDDCAPGVVFNPYEILAAGADDEISADAWEVPVVSGDFMMIRRTHFESIGGFDEGYRDGFEDVDLCLMARQRLGKRNFCMTEFAARRQTDPLRPASHDENFRLTRRNLRRLENRAGALVRSEMIADMFRQPPLLRPRPTRIAFAVTAVDMSGEAGDYLTACELGAELSRLYGWHVSYLEHAFWYDLDYFDIVVAMRHDFDPALIQSANPHLVLVGWARNWCDLWLSNRQTRQFDQIWASSSKFAQALRVRLGQRTPVIRIASNTTRFSCGKFCSSLQSDYCFTGSYFQSPRDIISAVNPESVPFSFAIYGHNWEKVPALASFSRGPLSYGRMPDVYASTKIVIDDSNFTTLQWGTLNSRVFDALASGALVLTNNSVGSDETFDGLLPHWSSRAELTDLLNHYLRNDTARQIVADKLKSIVFHRHSYTRRAQEVYQALSELVQARHRVGIVIASTFPSSEREALIDAIRSAVDCQSFIRARREIGGRSADESSAGDDVRIVIAAPGLEAKLATLRDDQVNILIALGSPADVAPGEIDRFDIAFVGDDEMARAFTSRTRVPVRALFDQPGSMARNVIRFDENGAAISLIDSYCLQIAVKKAIERHADICSSLTSAQRE